MTWFKVDDSFHSHPKATATSLAALGLWAVAGSWSGDHLTDGFVPDHQIPLLSRGTSKLADELVAAGLWRRTRGGYRFHDWTERNPTREQVEEDRRRRAEAGRKGGLASGKARSKRRTNAEAPASPIVEPPSRPPPSTKGAGGARPREAAPPPAEYQAVRAQLAAKKRAPPPKRDAIAELRAATPDVPAQQDQSNQDPTEGEGHGQV
ncbi:MAG TPA: hypothetical protein VFR23_04170 [Jiangellaceae bacterium]|nr:hypothetical protein [Jiangellaceae bacterium]